MKSTESINKTEMNKSIRNCNFNFVYPIMMDPYQNTFQKIYIYIMNPEITNLIDQGVIEGEAIMLQLTDNKDKQQFRPRTQIYGYE